jgi:hypothetical protein
MNRVEFYQIATIPRTAISPPAQILKAKSKMPSPSERDALTSRILPQMVLSKGDANSMTPPPAIPQKLVAEDRVKARFEVRGNAMYSSQMMMEEKLIDIA